MQSIVSSVTLAIDTAPATLTLAGTLITMSTVNAGNGSVSGAKAVGLVGVTKEAAAAKIPVIIIDSSIDDSAPVLTTIQSNNAENGRLVGEARHDGVMGGILEAQLRQNGRAGFAVVGQGWGCGRRTAG